MQVLVIGAGVVGLGRRARRGARRPRRDRCRGDRRHRQRRVLAQQRSRPWRPLLSDRFAARAPLRARPPHALRILREPRRRPSQMRQARRGDNQAELVKVETIKTQGEINGVEGLDTIGGNAARALEAELSCIGALAVAGIRHRRQPRIYARAVGRTRRSRRHDRVRDAGRAIKLPGAALARAIRRPRRRQESSSTPWSIQAVSARRRWRAASKVIRPTRCRGSSSPRAIISASPAGRCSRGWFIRRRSTAGLASM